MLIALSGGSPREREEIASALVESGKAGLIAYAQHEPKACYPYRRIKILGETLRGGGLRSKVKGVIVVHCLTEQEAELVRALGGTIWHLYSRPSAVVVIRNGDTMVTGGPDGFAHVRSPLEALSELMLAAAG